jgi:formate hydrogenlyase subunit 4
MIGLLLGCFLQSILIVALSPGVNGLIKGLKAFLQARRGPPVWQAYADLAKWLRKRPVYSEHATWISRTAPVVSFAAILCAGLLVPTMVRQAPLALSGDLIAFVYLLVLARFVTALGGLDAGGAFGGMGSSREMAISALAEPVMLLALFSLASRAGGSSLALLVSRAPGLGDAASLLACAALYVVLIAETGRVPVDNPDTHLELTMVHEGMILEASGPDLALYHWGAMAKQFLLLSLLINLFLPLGLADAVADGGAALVSSLLFVVKIGILAAALAATETAMAKLRIFRVPDLMGMAFALAVMGLAAGAVFHA